MQDDRDQLVKLIAAAKTASGKPTLEDQIRKLPTADLYRLSESLQSDLMMLAEKTPHIGAYANVEGKLGKIILDGLNHDIPVWHAIKAFLRFFKHDFRESRRLSRLRRANINAETAGPAELAGLLSENGINPIKSVIDRIKTTRHFDPMLAGEYAHSIASLEMTDAQKIFTAFTLYQSGVVSQAADLLKDINPDAFSDKQAERRARIMSEADYLAFGAETIVSKFIEDLTGSLAQVEMAELPDDAPFKMAYVAASTLPYNKVGYTTRTHRVVTAIQSAATADNSELVVVARPGFPFDRFDLKTDGIGDDLISDVDSIRYHYLRTQTPMQGGLFEFTLEAAYALTEFFVNHQVSAVTAASNHVNALPAYVAARALGLPFTYEVRGLWEETKASKLKGWDQSERFQVDRNIETFVIENADTTFFITRQVRELFFPPFEPDMPENETAFLAPNCAVLDDTIPVLSPYDNSQKDVLHLLYVGSLVEYEGLQLLLATLKTMEDRHKFRVTIVGGGKFAPTLENMSAEFGLNDIVTFTGRVDPKQVAEFYEDADIILIPRLPHRVCQLVSPLKPLEAMSYRKICLASNVAPIADLITHDETGFLFEAGDDKDLANTLSHIYKSQDRFSDIAENAYEYILKNRDWRQVGRNIYRVNKGLATP